MGDEGDKRRLIVDQQQLRLPHFGSLFHCPRVVRSLRIQVKQVKRLLNLKILSSSLV
jgi:hypothetical protein